MEALVLLRLQLQVVAPTELADTKVPAGSSGVVQLAVEEQVVELIEVALQPLLLPLLLLQAALLPREAVVMVAVGLKAMKMTLL